MAIAPTKPKKSNPLAQKVPIVDKDGRPTKFFIRQWVKQRAVEGSIGDVVDAVSELITRQLVAGTGLTGGGDLSADRIFNVGAGVGIAVDADSVLLDADIDDLNDVNSPAPSDGDVLIWDDGNSWWAPGAQSGGGGGAAPNLFWAQDQQTSGTNGGSATASTYNTRVLNTVLVNEIGGASLATNQITLPAGTYYIEAVCPCSNIGLFRARIRDVTNSVTLVLGNSGRTGGGGFGNAAFGSVANVAGQFALSGTAAIEVQHFVSSNAGAISMGTGAGSGENEVFAEVRIWQLSSIVAFEVIHVREEQTSGTSGGSPSTGVRNKRVLNTTVLNTISGAALDAVNDEIDLPAGTYEIHARAPGYRCGRHKAFLRNVTDSVDTLLGSSVFQDTGADGDQGDSEIHGRFTIAAAKSFSIEQYFQFNSGGSFTMGVETSEGTNEVYTEVIIVKVA